MFSSAMGKSRSATVLLAYLLWSSRQVKPTTASSVAKTSDNETVHLPPNPLSVIDALTLLRQGRPIAEPNEGFMDQLYLYVDMGCPSTQSELESHKLYRRWMNKRNVAESLRINQAPELDDILFEDESDKDLSNNEPTTRMADLSLSNRTDHQPQEQERIAPDISARAAAESLTSKPNANSLASLTTNNTSQSDLLIKCRRCRHLLARSNFIIPHSPLHSDPLTHQNPSSQNPDRTSPSTLPAPQSQCAHVFLHPLSWMKSALSPGSLSGKLSCPNPKCGANIGKFAWQGLRCSCGGWITPGFAVGRGKVDEISVGGGQGAAGAGDRSTVAAGGGGGTDGAGGGGAAGIRLPPGMRRGGNL